MKVVVAMDSMKGSLSSLEAGNAVSEGIHRVFRDAEVTGLPSGRWRRGNCRSPYPWNERNNRKSQCHRTAWLHDRGFLWQNCRKQYGNY